MIAIKNIHPHRHINIWHTRPHSVMTHQSMCPTNSFEVPIFIPQYIYRPVTVRK